MEIWLARIIYAPIVAGLAYGAIVAEAVLDRAIFVWLAVISAGFWIMVENSEMEVRRTLRALGLLSRRPCNRKGDNQ